VWRNASQLDKVVRDSKFPFDGHRDPALPPATRQNLSQKTALSACNPVTPPNPHKPNNFPTQFRPRYSPSKPVTLPITLSIQ
jgi:hypothetical protein